HARSWRSVLAVARAWPVLLAVDGLAGGAREAHLAAVFEEPVADLGWLVRFGIQQGHVGDVDRGLAFDDCAGVGPAWLGVALDDVDAGNDHAPLGRQHAQHVAHLALAAPGDDLHPVALPDLELVGHGFYRTSGASEMIFMNFLARSSRVTGPKMRVPIGSACLLMRAAALRSKRMALPSPRRSGNDVRTTTARWTSPFLTRPRGIASLMETTMTSPTLAYMGREPPSTLMHWTRRAPELSATSRLVRIWIMFCLPCAFKPSRLRPELPSSWS